MDGVYDSINDRFLLRDGRSIVSPETFSKRTIQGKDMTGFCVFECFDVLCYEDIFGGKISVLDDETPFIPALDAHEHSDEDFERLCKELTNSPRFEDGEKFVDRIDNELRFFLDTKNISFLLKVSDVIKKFDEMGVVWGVGRGSACASLLLYVLRVHDVNPLKYNIPFNELSKTGDYD